jgi:hypothetical protein
MEGGQDPLGNMFQTMFGRRRRGGRSTGQQWLQPGAGALPPYVAQYGRGPDGLSGYDYGGQAPQYAGQYGYIWRGDQPIAYDPNLGVPQGYSVFHRGQDALAGLPGVGGAPGGAGGQGYGGGRGGGRGGGGQPAITGGTRYRGGPAGAPWFANADGTVFANGMNAPDIGGQPGVDPNSPYYIAPGLPGGAATIPWQGSWADPASANFYLRQFGLQTPSDYLNPGANQQGGRRGGWGNGWTGGPQGAPPQPYPPGGNGPTGPGQPPTTNLGAPPPSGNWTAPTAPPLSSIYGPTFGREGNPAYGWGAVPGQTAANNWTPPGGNQTMYPGMPYAGGMGANSGWLPPVPGIPTDYSGQPPMGVDNSGYPIGGQVPGAPTNPAQPGGPNSGWLPPAPGAQTNWGDAGQYASPLDAATAQYGGAPAGGTPQPTTGLAGSQYYNQFGNPWG